MKLITMAHRGEAQGVIDQFQLTKVKPHFFSGKDFSLLLTGEGPFEASTELALELGAHPYSEVINLGIAGSLSAELTVGEIYPIRTHYLIQGEKPSFKTFTGNSEGVDCLTSFERILNPDKAEVLRGLGEIVDREAWGLAFAAKSAGIPYRSFKLISDVAGTLGSCELTREHAEVFAEKLSHFLKTLIIENEIHPEEILNLPGIYFTFTMSHRFNQLIKKIAIKNNKDRKEVIESLPLNSIPQSSPKERARLLIEFLENEIDPLRSILENKKRNWLKGVKDITVKTDPEWERPEVKFEFTVLDDQDLLQKIEILKAFSLKPFQKIREGMFNVE